MVDVDRHSTGRLIVVCGLPGSGKTTHALRLAGAAGAIRLSADEWLDDLGLDLWDEERRARVEALQWKHAQALLALGATVIIEWGTWGRAERDTLRSGARALGARVELHYLRARVDLLFERVRARGLEQPAITRTDLDGWARTFQAPTDEELALFDSGIVIEQE